MKRKIAGSSGIHPLLALVALCAAALLLSACGGSSSSSSDNSEATTGGPETKEAAETKGSEEGKSGAIDGEGKKIAFLAFGFGNSYSDAATQAAREEASKLNVSVEAFDGKFDPANQASQCQDAVTSGRFSAIIVGAVSGPAIIPCAAQAEAAGIPVVAFGDTVGSSTTSKVPTEPGVVANVFTPIQTLYGALGESIVEACEGINPCRIVDLNDLEIQPEVAAVFTKKLEEVESENPGIEVVEQPEAGLEVSTGQAAMQDIIAKGTEFDLVTSTGAQTMSGALIAMRSAGMKIAATGEGIRIVAAGTTEEQVKEIEEGEIWGSSTTLPITEGKTGVEVATKAMLGMPFPKSSIPPEVLGTPLVISVDNKAEWKGFEAQWSE